MWNVNKVHIYILYIHLYHQSKSIYDDQGLRNNSLKLRYDFSCFCAKKRNTRQRVFRWRDLWGTFADLSANFPDICECSAEALGPWEWLKTAQIYTLTVYFSFRHLNHLSNSSVSAWLESQEEYSQSVFISKAPSTSSRFWHKLTRIFSFQNLYKIWH